MSHNRAPTFRSDGAAAGAVRTGERRPFGPACTPAFACLRTRGTISSGVPLRFATAWPCRWQGPTHSWPKHSLIGIALRFYAAKAASISGRDTVVAPQVPTGGAV